MRLLIIEDEVDILKALATGLRKKGYAVDTAEDGEEGSALLTYNQYDLLVLDLNLPSMDGIELLKQLRRKNKEIKVLILTARWEIEERVRGLDEGANDYMVKPFHFDELEARIRALLRRSFRQEDVNIEYGDLLMNTASRSAQCAGKPLDLTGKEYSILEYLLRHPDQTISTEEILEHVWDSEVDLLTNTIKVHMSTLRKKLKECCGQDLILNIRGAGYRLGGQKG